MTITCADDGPGLTSDEAARAFERGFRGRTSRGSGLGLHGARELMVEQGGDLALEPTTTGATFVMTLPRVPSRDPAAARGAGPGPAGPRRPPRAGPTRCLSHDRPSILTATDRTDGALTRAVLVDDHQLLAQTLALALGFEGIECTVADLSDREALVSEVVEELPRWCCSTSTSAA